MREDFLHFIWQYQYYHRQNLATDQGQSLEIIEMGHLNLDAGPDFLMAHIRINEIDWRGNIEIHIKASDWDQHRHSEDPAYQNVVLHVVWEANREIKHPDGTAIPSLSLASRVDLQLLGRYQSLVENLAPIPCAAHLPKVNVLYRIQAMDQALVQRLERKSLEIQKDWHECQGDWEEATYRLLLRNMGFKKNRDAFQRLSEALPFKLIRKHQGQALALEALLFGHSGWLEKPLKNETQDDYQQTLRKEYLFLKKKFQLEDSSIKKSDWKFGKMRPPNFPSLRIAQLSAILANVSALFSFFLHEEMDEIRNLFSLAPSPYWQGHYDFGKRSKQLCLGMGKKSVDTLIINSLPPLLSAYAQIKKEEKYITRAMFILEQVPAENNRILRLWEEMGVKVQSAFDSQALLELYKEYCQAKQCLNCSIGQQILKEAALNCYQTCP